jgi:DEAD/DEAH box helicase/Helicase conserved C-terminal domain
MAEPLSVEQLRELAHSPDAVSADAFGVLRSLAALMPVTSEEEDALPVDDGVGRELVIRFLEHRDRFGDYGPILDSLAHRVGLFPYVTESSLTGRELLELEWNRPEGDAVDDYIFHAAQGLVYRALLRGENVVLSAPTSFGKSLVIDAIVASERFANIAVIVPTIALLDETRRRLSAYGSSYKLVTHVSQLPAERNIFVMTQERLLDYVELPRIEFFVIDEFYKLDLRQDPDRAALLNKAFYRLWKDGGQFYLLGPNVESIATDVPWKATWIRTDFRTVAVDTRSVDLSEGERGALVGLCRDLDEPTIIYCKSPARTRVVARWLLEAGIGGDAPQLGAAAQWVGDAFHRDWLVARALAHGIGVHHGRLPRALAHLITRLFNSGQLRFLICTSTLIEGVNTAAKNVVVFDKKISNKNFDFFTYNNIRGRGGRMFRHFVGRVFLFSEPPNAQLPIVDMPVFTQSEETPTYLLLELEPEELTADSKERVAPYVTNDLLPVEVLRENAGIDLDGQLALAQKFEDDPRYWSDLLSWQNFPKYEELVATCKVIWDDLGGSSAASVQAIRSDLQLAFYLNRLRAAGGDARVMIGHELESRDPDDAVENVLEFTRAWPGHHFPRYLRALQRIEEIVFPRHGVRVGQYAFYAGRVESLFLPPFANALEEYGIPTELAMGIPGLLDPADSLDVVLDRLRGLEVSTLELTVFERYLLADARQSL